MAKARKRRHSRREAAARRRFVLGVLLFLLVVAAAIRWSDAAWRYLAAVPAPVPLSATAQPVVPSGDDGAARAERVAYRYSIIDGGARTVEELKKAIAADPVVAAHYANFSLENTRVERLREPRLAHVSYRMGDAVYWTRKPVALRSGEAVLTDGVHIARTRCGNQLAETPGEISPLEPPPGALDLPVSVPLTSLGRLRRLDLPTSLPAGLLPGTTFLAGGSELLSLDPTGQPSPPLMLGGALPGISGSPEVQPEEGGAVPEPHVPPEGPGPIPPAPPYGAPIPGPPPLPPLIPPEVFLPPGTDLPLPPGGIEPTPHEQPEEPAPVPVPVPEPATGLFIVAGGMGYAVRRLLRRA